VFGTRLGPEPRDAVRLTAIVGGLRPRTVREAIGARTPGPAGIPLVR